MTEKNIKFNTEARDKIMRGIDTLANAVKATLGPGGRNVIIDGLLVGRPRPRMTKDGVTVARAVQVSDPFEKMGAEIAKDAAEKQNEDVGDGTTTVTVLTQAIVREGIKYIATGMNPTELRRGIDLAADIVNDFLADMAVPVDDNRQILNVAMVSANGDKEIAEAIAKAMREVGAGGVLTVEESATGVTEIEIVPGMMFDKGYAYPVFVNRPNYTCELENPVILVFDGKISRLADITPLLEECVEAGRSILLIADGYEDQIMQTLVLNRTGGGLINCPVRTPAWGPLKEEILFDIVTATGGQLISHNSSVSLYKTRIANCGSAKRVIIRNNCTVIVGGAGEDTEIEDRCEHLKSEMAEAKGDERKNYEMRLASMTGGIAVIKVGGATEVEIRERKDRVDDAIHATKAAAKNGILPGGGVSLVYAARQLENIGGNGPDQDAGIAIMRNALLEPLKTIAANAGVEGAEVLGRLKSEGAASFQFGYDAHTEEYGDMVDMGIIDPASVVMASVANAASVGGMLLTTEALLTFIKPEANDAD